MARAFTCERCGKVKSTDAARGPLPTVCDPCKIATGVPVRVSYQGLPVAAKPAPARDPFNSTPFTAAAPAPEPLAGPVAQQVSAEPGPLETQLTAELAAMQMINPTAQTQSLLALQLARAADRLDPGEIKTMLAVGKELRTILDGLNKAPRAGGDDDDRDKPFGAVRPEMVHPPAV